jgi:hypothetical protein
MAQELSRIESIDGRMNVGRWCVRCPVAMVLVAAVCAPAAAQVAGGALAGNVVDQAGPVIPGATVTVSTCTIIRCGPDKVLASWFGKYLATFGE